MANSLRARILAGVGANAYGQIINVVVQLLTLPIYFLFWNASKFGEWAMLSAGPAYLALSDFGMVSAATNSISNLATLGRREDANSVFQSALVLNVFLSISTLLIVVVIVHGMDIRFLSARENRIALYFLVLLVLQSTYTGLFSAVFRVHGAYAKGTYFIESIKLAEWFGGILGLAIGGSMISVAGGMLGARSLGTLFLYLYVRRSYTDFIWGWSQASSERIKDLLKPALSFLAFPIGNGISIQGMTLVVGQLFGPVSLATFVAYRTLSRAILQFVGSLSHALWPEFSRQYAERNFGEMSLMYRTSLRLSVVTAAVSSGALLAFGRIILDVWSHDQIPFVFSSFAWFVLAAMIGGLWHVPRILGLATNHHTVLSGIYLVASLGLVVIVFATARVLGELVVAPCMVIFELVMLVASLLIANKVLAENQSLESSA